MAKRPLRFQYTVIKSALCIIKVNSKETFEISVYRDKEYSFIIKVNSKETFEISVYRDKEYSLY